MTKVWPNGGWTGQSQKKNAELKAAAEERLAKRKLDPTKGLSGTVAALMGKTKKRGGKKR